MKIIKIESDWSCKHCGGVLWNAGGKCSNPKCGRENH